MFSVVVFACLLAVGVARPDSRYSAPPAHSQSYRGDNSDERAVIELDERNHPGEGGAFDNKFRTSNGIYQEASGYGSGPDGAVETQGVIRFTFPNGEDFELTYVADAAGGYQPKSSYLPVAPEFPHPIPKFVLDQIAKAERERAEGHHDDSDERRRYN